MALLRDVRFGFRMLARNPGLTAAAILSLAIGAGATTTVFTLVDSLLLRPLPGVAAPDRLVNLFRREEGETRAGGGFPLAVYRDYRDANSVLGGLAVYTDRALSLSRGGESQLVAAQIVSGNYLSVLGARPARGRFFLPEEDRTTGTHAVAMVSDALWRRKLGGDPSLVGSRLILNGIPFTVVGIAPAGFGGTFFGFVYDVWIPTAMADPVLQRTDLQQRRTVWLEAVGRLRPGVSLPTAQAALNTIARRLARQYPEDRRREILLTPVTGYDQELHGGVVAILAVLLALAGSVLVIACANVASMLLARAVGRRREIAIRLAMGMSRRGLVAQLLAEGLLLALPAGGAGVLLAGWGVELMRRFEPPVGIPLVLDFHLDLRVLAFTLAVALLSGLAFGLVPAAQALKPDLAGALADSSRIAGGRGSRLRNAFVAGQVAVSLLLLVTAGLFLRALQQAGAANPGFDPRRVEVLSLDPSVLGMDASRAAGFFQRLRDRIEGLPAVQAVSLADSTPLGLGNLFGGKRTAIEVAGRQPAPGKEAFEVEYSVIGTRYFEALRIPLLRGRDFTTADREGTRRVAIVNQTLAGHFWPGEDPIGKRFVRDAHDVEVVGLARDSKYTRVNEQPREFLYLPCLQVPSARLSLFVRTAGEPSAMAPALRREVRQQAPNLPILSLMTMQESIAVSRLPQRIAATVASLLGLTGLLLAAVGIYGVISYSVAQRRHEFGIRMAVGATHGSVLRLVVRQGLLLALAGVAVGSVAAFAASRLLASLLLGLDPSDPLAFAGVALLLLLTATAASLLPAQRAMHTDPLVALRVL